jgi:hypothetical protein
VTATARQPQPSAASPIATPMRAEAVPSQAAGSAPGPVKPEHLLSPTLDVLLIGGASLVMGAMFWLFVEKSDKTNQISWTAFYLAFLINNPHFMASYGLLYWDKRKELLSNKRFLWAAVVAPALLVSYLVAALSLRSGRMLGYAVNFMYFTVGWHYVKQIYGTVIVTSARRRYFFSKGEALALKANLFPVWFMSFFNGNTSMRTLDHYGVSYQTMDLPQWLVPLNFGLVAVSLAGLAVLLFRKYLREGKVPGWPALTSMAAIYCWYLPSMYHAHFWYLIPFFHSLQYMLFVWTLKRNQFKAEAASAAPDDEPRQRWLYSRGFLGFVALTTVAGWLMFEQLPTTLDAYMRYDETVFGPTLFMYLFITFINIHHYFIDNVLWRRDNPALKRYL